MGPDLLLSPFVLKRNPAAAGFLWLDVSGGRWPILLKNFSL
jgi:hypothetical protein